EDVEVGGSINSGINITNAGSVEVLNCYVHDVVNFYGVRAVSTTAPFKGKISDNTVRHIPLSGIYLDGLTAGEGRRKLLRGYCWGGASAHGIFPLGTPAGAGGDPAAGGTATA